MTPAAQLATEIRARMKRERWRFNDFARAAWPKREPANAKQRLARMLDRATKRGIWPTDADLAAVAAVFGLEPAVLRHARVIDAAQRVVVNRFRA